MQAMCRRPPSAPHNQQRSTPTEGDRAGDCGHLNSRPNSCGRRDRRGAAARAGALPRSKRAGAQRGLPAFSQSLPAPRALLRRRRGQAPSQGQGASALQNRCSSAPARLADIRRWRRLFRRRTVRRRSGRRRPGYGRSATRESGVLRHAGTLRRRQRSRSHRRRRKRRGRNVRLRRRLRTALCGRPPAGHLQRRFAAALRSNLRRTALQLASLSRRQRRARGPLTLPCAARARGGARMDRARGRPASAPARSAPRARPDAPPACWCCRRWRP
jgi:hypothetical protein